jgi:hypothetical protein
MKFFSFFKKPEPVVDPVLKRLDELSKTREYLLSKEGYDPTDNRLHPEYENAIRKGVMHCSDGYGPRIEMTTSCHGCSYYRTKTVKTTINDGEWPKEVRTETCEHPFIGGETLQHHGRTPSFCPYIEFNVEHALKKFRKTIETN